MGKKRRGVTGSDEAPRKTAEGPQEMSPDDEVRVETARPQVAMFQVAMPMANAQRMNVLCQRLGCNAVDLFGRAMDLFDQVLVEHDKHGSERISVSWNNGNPQVGKIQLAGAVPVPKVRLH